jgi:excisionase family DNA binding protein
MITALSAVNSFGNFCWTSASNQLTVRKTVPTSGNAPHRPTLTSHPGPSYSCTPSQSDSDGKPNTPPLNSLLVDHHPATVRQLTIKPREGEQPVQKYLTVSETAAYLNTSERFVRRLISERRIAFHHVGRHVRFALTDLDEWLAASRVEPLSAEVIVRVLRSVA